MDPLDARELDAWAWAQAEELVDALGHVLTSWDPTHGAGLAAADIDGMFRNAHTLKGLLRTVSAPELAELAHELEDRLEHLRRGRCPADADVHYRLLSAVESLAAACARRQAGLPPDGLALPRGRQALAQSAEPADSEPAGAADGDDARLDALERQRLDAASMEGRRLLSVSARVNATELESAFVELERLLAAHGEVLARSLAPVAAEGEQLTLRMWLALGSGAEAMSALVAAVGAEEHGGGLLLEDVAPRAAPARPLAAPPRALPANASARAGNDAGSVHSVRVDIRRLDQLLRAVGELQHGRDALQGLARRVRALPGGAEPAAELRRESERLERRAQGLQKSVMQARMVPISQLFERVLRVGQQAAHELNKNVRFVVQGEATELDKHIVETLVDPTMHLVRNAIDHGIESAALRTEAGKPAAGTVRLSARARGHQVVVQVADDGAGIDAEGVRATAVARGLVTAQAAPWLDEQQLFSLLMQPGFSTRREVSAYSGRGVGLDVAKTELEALGGALEAAANEPAGTTFSLVTPITLAVVPAMVVRARGERYVLPLAHVLDAVEYVPADAFDAPGGRTIRIGDDLLLLACLAETLGLPERHEQGPTSYVVVVGIAGRRMAIWVDDVLAQRDVLVKSLGPRLAAATLFAGAADVGSDAQALVVDTLALLNATDGAGRRP